MRVSIKHDNVRINNLGLAPVEEQLMRDFTAASSDTWTGFVDGQIACVWGIIPPSLLSNQAYLWLHTNSKVKEHQFLFVRHSQMQLKKLLEEYEMITGVCLIDAKKSIRWLKWLGAVFEQPKGNLIPFKITRE